MNDGSENSARTRSLIHYDFKPSARVKAVRFPYSDGISESLLINDFESPKIEVDWNFNFEALVRIQRCVSLILSGQKPETEILGYLNALLVAATCPPCRGQGGRPAF